MNRTINLNGKIVNEGTPTYIVAEIGINHNGNINLAKKLIKEAKKCGADAVKFQKRNLKLIYKNDIYKDPNKDSQSTAYLIDIIKRFELKEKEFIELKKFCDDLGITFFCTPFDIDSVDFLEKIDVSFYKIASGDLTNAPLISYIVKTRKPMILSTGMSQMDEIDFAVKFIKKNKVNLALLHCVSTYPASFKDINLKLINVLRQRYKVPVGYSGHERGIMISICAVAMGAKIIERHLTLDRSMEGPDHNISLTPEGFGKMVERIRAIEMAMGDGQKTTSRGEYLTREVFAKSLVCRRFIRKGTIIKANMIDVKSPGKGLNPQKINYLIGQRAKRDINKFDYFNDLDII